jgi:hypothetical protein
VDDDDPPRVLFAPGVGRAELDRLAVEDGWSLLHILARREGRPRQVFWATADGEAMITLVDDHRVDARYAVVSAHAPGPTLRRIRSVTRWLSRADVLALAEAPATKVRGLSWLGIVAPREPVEPIASTLERALGADDPRAREAARFAVEASGWAITTATQP